MTAWSARRSSTTAEASSSPLTTGGTCAGVSLALAGGQKIARPHTAGSELPGERAPYRLRRQIHAIGSAVAPGKAFAAEVVVDILHPSEKVLRECILDAGADRIADIGRVDRVGLWRTGCDALLKAEARDSEAAGGEEQPMTRRVARLGCNMTVPSQMIGVGSRRQRRWRRRRNDDHSVARCVAPAKIALDPEHQRSGLPIISSEEAAYRAVR